MKEQLSPLFSRSAREFLSLRSDFVRNSLLSPAFCVNLRQNVDKVQLTFGERRQSVSWIQSCGSSPRAPTGSFIAGSAGAGVAPSSWNRAVNFQTFPLARMLIVAGCAAFR